MDKCENTDCENKDTADVENSESVLIDTQIKEVSYMNQQQYRSNLVLLTIIYDYILF